MIENTTKIVGITGQTGAGKSVVSDYLTERGFRVINCDLVARDVVKKGKECLLELACEFGYSILNSDGTLNRAKLGGIVFGNKDMQKKLNRIIFPHIQREISEMLDELRKSGEGVVFLDAPTLFESGTDKFCDSVVSVIAREEDRFLRIVRRDNISAEAAGKRMSAQQNDDFYTSRSDFVIHNNGDMTELKVRVLEMLDFIGATLPKTPEDKE